MDGRLVVGGVSFYLLPGNTVCRHIAHLIIGRPNCAIIEFQDVLVNVTDLSHPQFYAQRANVQHVLEQLRLKQGQLNAMINVLNKSDKVYVVSMVMKNWSV